MEDPQRLPDTAIKVEGSVSKDPKKGKPGNIRPGSKKPLQSEPDGNPMIVTTIIDPKEPQDVGEIIAKKPKNVKGIKVDVKRTPGGSFTPVTEKDVTDKSKPDKDSCENKV